MPDACIGGDGLSVSGGKTMANSRVPQVRECTLRTSYMSLTLCTRLR